MTKTENLGCQRSWLPKFSVATARHPCHAVKNFYLSGWTDYERRCAQDEDVCLRFDNILRVQNEKTG